MPPAAAAAVLSVPGLLAATVPTRVAPCNFNAGLIVGTNQVRNRGTVDFTVNLDGTGEIVGVIDSGCDTGVLATLAADIAPNVRVLRNQANPANPAVDTFIDANGNAAYHGTHVVGTICGTGAAFAGPPPVVGMAPNAALVVQGPIPNNFVPSFNFAAGQGAALISNSWGHFPVPGQPNRYLPNRAEAVDRWCFLNPEVLVLFAAGNEETDANGNGTLDGVGMRQQALAKNALTIGASENLRSDGGWANSYVNFFGNGMLAVAGANGAAGTFSVSDNPAQVALFSGRGRVRRAGGSSTGRIKPDLVAPGTNILSLRSSAVPPVAGSFDANVPAGVPAATYSLLLGTSMATPVAAGNATLLRQFFRTRYAQLRRPFLLEGAAIPVQPPLPAPPVPVPGFASRPAIARHPDGLVCAWVTADLPGAARRIVALRLARHLSNGSAVPVEAAPVLLQAGVGDHAALQVAVVGERTYLLHRHGDGSMRLSCWSRTLAPVAGFGTAGVVTLQPAARPDDAAPPVLRAVNDQLVCVWPTAGNKGGFFQRFRASDGGAVDAAAVSLLFHDATGEQHPLAWSGSAYGFCGVLIEGGRWKLQLRQVNAAGQVQGAGPVTVADQATEIREPCLLWDVRGGGRHVMAWCDARNAPGGEIWLQFLNAQGAPQGAAQKVLGIAGARLRRPRLTTQPDAGYLLAWEDDSQGGRFDLYVTLLGADGLVDTRLDPDPGAGGRRLQRLSDTPGDVAGYALVRDSEGFVLAYQSPDELNADRVGVFLLHLTRTAGFEAREDAATPLQRGGNYVVAELLDHDGTALTELSAAWTGASWDLLRVAPGDAAGSRLQWLRLTADGVPDALHGAAGVRELPFPGLVTGLELLWTGNRRIAAVNDMVSGVAVHLADAEGVPVPGFGLNGVAPLLDTVPVHDRVTPQPGFVSQPAFAVVVGYGGMVSGAMHLRMQRLDGAGKRIGNPADLGAVDGVAAHQWFQFVNGEGRAIAVYHRVNGAATQVLCRQFNLQGSPAGDERRLSAAAGEAINGVVARRPVAVNSARREYGAVWQYRSGPAAKWEIRFSRLGRDGRPMATHPVAGMVLAVADVPVVDATMPEWSATRDAVSPQLVCSYTHAPWSSPVPAGVTPPEWSSSWGLAWIGVEADGSSRLYFTALDENGRRLPVPQPPPYPKPALPASGLNPPSPAPVLVLGSGTGRIRDFRLAWNGRVFLLAWTEEEGGRLRQRCTLVNRQAGLGACALPSAALLRATLVNGATNLTPAPLPDLAAGYGWGRINMRQVLAPALPFTFQVRDDCAIGPGRTVHYRFVLPPDTRLLRVTLHWTDAPGARLVNHLRLTLRAPGAAGEFRGNLWDTAAGRTHLSRLVALPPVPADNHDTIHPYKQVVIQDPAPGEYVVEVSAAAFPADPFNQQNLQPFALVFAGTGAEVTYNPVATPVAGAAVY
ncbi:S8 family serine peptidase [Azohydromonas aeria]|uniref:S8 family serine peptidase n=1 Tax=Azohydromonas aeria TaxID=2590212 RepID=UPI0018DFF6E5|nr:S8 family serine peptidase [Azohydromonas aeria]